MPTVSLILLALNEAEALPLLVPHLPASADEVLLVDNGSRDGTAAVAQGLGLTVVTAPQRGYGAAAWAGLQAAKGEILAFAAADGSDPIDQLDLLLAPLIAGEADFVLAHRCPSTSALTWPQQVGNALACRLIHWRWGVRFSDLGPFRALRAETLHALQMRDRGFGWTMEMQAKVAAQGLPWRQIPLPYRPRLAGHSKISGTLRGTLRASLVILWTFARLALKRYRHG